MIDNEMSNNDKVRTIPNTNSSRICQQLHLH